MVWALDLAECINKILYIKGYSSISNYIKKYSKEAKRLTMKDYLKAMQNIGVNQHHDDKDL
jgi:hypothetical protein